MKKKILTQLFILSFAFAGLFVVGNNLMAQDAKESDTIEPGITCGQHCGLCWIETNNVTTCKWKGQMRYSCWGNCPK